MSNIGVYTLRHNHSGLFYIGYTTDLHRRQNYHRSDLNRGVHCSPRFQEAYNLDNAITWQFTPCCTRDEALDAERTLIKQHAGDPLLCNINHAGVLRSPEVRERMSQSRIGFKHTPETIAKMSAVKTGSKQKPRKEEHCANIAKRLMVPVVVDSVQYESGTAAAEKYGVVLSTVMYRVRSDRPAWDGWSFV